MHFRKEVKLRRVDVVASTLILVSLVKGGSMSKAYTTETRKMKDNNGKPYYLHIQYDKMGNPIRRQVSRVEQPNNLLAWHY